MVTKIINALMVVFLVVTLVPRHVGAEDACQNTITRGDWEGTTHQRFEYRLVIPAQGMPQDTIYEGNLIEDGTLVFTVNGCAVTNASWHTRMKDGWQRWQEFDGTIEECTISSMRDFTQGAENVVTGPTGLPELDITFANASITTLVAEGADFCDDTVDLPPLTFQFQLTTPEDTEIRNSRGIWYMVLNGVIGDPRRLAEEYVRQGADVVFDQDRSYAVGLDTGNFEGQTTTCSGQFCRKPFNCVTPNICNGKEKAHSARGGALGAFG